MGLSSSQGRLLLLTSRLSDIELQETMLSHRQNLLALDSMNAAEKHMKAMNNYTIRIKTDNEDSTGYTKQKLTYKNLTENGYLLTDGRGNIYLNKDDAGKWIQPFINGSQTNDGKAISNLLIDDENDTCIVQRVDEDGNFVDRLNSDEEITSDPSESMYYDAATMTPYKIADASKFSTTEAIEKAITNGYLFLIDTNKPEPETITMEELASDEGFVYELDTSDDAQAESEYEYTLATVKRQENALEMEIKRLETEHEAVLKEIDSVKQVISNNVDRTFKLFSNG